MLVRTIAGTTVSCAIYPSLSGRALRDTVSLRTGVPTRSFYLCFQSRVVHDSNLCADIGITHGHCVVQCARLYGGVKNAENKTKTIRPRSSSGSKRAFGPKSGHISTRSLPPTDFDPWAAYQAPQHDEAAPDVEMSEPRCSRSQACAS